MNDARYLLMFTAADEDAPKNVRLWSLVGARKAATRLNLSMGVGSDGVPIGRWSVHEVGEAIED